ncbi:DUF2520 domain-containing protein [Aquimarina sp. ERC-38]|uniref:Rossmann-like and DUF2520 domain-containing protein n=1 Tax=Aquimarina sp. ERC-38 TaxID=2949996 RepID=UPI002247F034|nr:DUF2520 domain-containing protein [Aquimarina sp. ERC-38]UZO79728.1 DUF2520 domain-containing protein [Aquimarina sp. ERC-38]
MIRISILGAGPVARFFYRELEQLPKVEIIQCYNRKGRQLHEAQNQNTIISNTNQLKEADLYLIAVADRAIEEVAGQIPFKEVGTVHTSGATDIDILKEQPNRGVWYPLQTFSSEATVEASEIPFCLEASNTSLFQLLKKLSLQISPRVYHLSSAQRKQLHIAAVFSNNFVNHLMTISHDICEEHQVPYELLIPLIKKTMQNGLKTLSGTSQTGPAIRKDNKTIENHLKLLPSHQQLIYRILTEAIQNYYGEKL